MELITSENIILIGSILLIAGVLIGKSSYRFGLPLLLIFLLVGMAFRHRRSRHPVQQHALRPIHRHDSPLHHSLLRRHGHQTLGNTPRHSPRTHTLDHRSPPDRTAHRTVHLWLSGMDWTNIHFAFIPSLLLAATMSSTDSASVFGILGSQKVGLRNHLRPMLELESGSNDPMAYMLTIILIETITLGGELSAGSIILELILQFGVGATGGFLMGKLTLWLIAVYRRIDANAQSKEDTGQATSMISILMIGAVFFTFAATTALAGNGYLAVYICGIVLGNATLPNHRGITKFLDGMTWLAQIVVFLMLGLLVNPHEMIDVAAVSLLIGIFMILIGRPLSIFLTLAPLHKISLRSKAFISWVGLRGAVPIIFATYPIVSGIEGAGQIFNIVFFITILSLLIQGTTVITAARRLDLISTDNPDNEDFGVELADELPTSLQTLTLTPDHLAKATTLRDMQLPPGNLVMMIRRGNRYIVPNGTRHLQPGDTLLIIKEDSANKPGKV